MTKISNVSVTMFELDLDPCVSVYRVEVQYDHGGVWVETLTSLVELEAFYRGLKAAYEGINVPLLQIPLEHKRVTVEGVSRGASQQMDKQERTRLRLLYEETLGPAVTNEEQASLDRQSMVDICNLIERYCYDDDQDRSEPTGL